MPQPMQPIIFEDLRDEVKIKIFSLLSPLERQIIRPVCTDWKDIVDEEFGIKLVVNNGSTDNLSNSACAVELEMNSLTIPVESTGLVFTHKLHTLRFHNIVVTYNLLPLLKNFASSLTTLSFHQIIVDLPEQLQVHAISTVGNNVITLPRLKNLEVQEWNMSESLMALFDFILNAIKCESVANISIFLQNPPMMPLQLLFNGDISSAPAFLKIVKKSERTLETFKYGKQNSVLSMKFYPFGSLGPDQPLQLQEFICHSQFKTDWLPILPSQSKLIKFHIGDCRVGMWEEIRNTIRRNSQTLETFWISGQSFNQRWDCSVFQNFSRLNKLGIQLYMSPKINLTSVPNTITSFHISGSIKKNEMFLLLPNLQNCTELEFSHLGINQAADTPEDRVNLDLFLRFIRLPFLTKISFLHCDWNDTDWEEVIQYCSANVAHGIHFEQLFYPLHGQEIRHGIHVQIHPHFERSGRDIVPVLEPRHSGDTENMCQSIFTALFWWI